MTDHPHPHHEVDRIARRLHAEAVAQVPARTLLQLRARRPDAPAALAPAGRPVMAWTLAAACAVVFAVAIGLSPYPSSPGSGGQAPLAEATTEDSNSPYGEALAALEEDPDFYLWLGTTDVQPLAME